MFASKRRIRHQSTPVFWQRNHLSDQHFKWNQMISAKFAYLTYIPQYIAPINDKGGSAEPSMYFEPGKPLKDLGRFHCILNPESCGPGKKMDRHAKKAARNRASNVASPTRASIPRASSWPLTGLALTAPESVLGNPPWRCGMPQIGLGWVHPLPLS